MPKVASPVLVIHGTEDEVIDFSHGLAIYEKCPRAVEPLWVEVSPKIYFIRVNSFFFLKIIQNYIQMSQSESIGDKHSYSNPILDYL